MKNLIVFIIIFVIFLGFIVLNLGNKCDISFGFIILPEVPVFLTALLSFMLGLLLSVPLALSAAGKRKKKLSTPAPKKLGKHNEEATVVDEIKKEDSSYGID